MPPLSPVAYPLAELVALARAQSPYYGQLYAHLPADSALSGLPVVDPAAFWAAHHHDRREVLTGTQIDGLVLNSGGTTGAPKFSYFSEQDWESTVALSTLAFEVTGLQDGDRVANLFGSGNLYASFTFVNQSLHAARVRVVQFPIGYFAAIADAAGFIQRFNVNVLAGLPTHLSSLIDHIDKEKMTSVHIQRILYAGEMFSPDQRAFLEARHPGVSIRSVGYASVDAGLIAYADETGAPGVHRVFDGATLIEIFDEETGAVIEAAGQPGKIVFTNLVRRLMPILRYPTGDRAEWLDPAGTPGRRFTLLGRSGEGARIAGCTVMVSEVRSVLEPHRARLGIGEFQLLITREGLQDQLTLRIVGNGAREALAAGGDAIIADFLAQKPTLGKMIATGAAQPMRVEWIERQALMVNAKTGKLRLVADQRGD